MAVGYLKLHWKICIYFVSNLVMKRALTLRLCSGLPSASEFNWAPVLDRSMFHTFISLSQGVPNLVYPQYKSGLKTQNFIWFFFFFWSWKAVLNTTVWWGDLGQLHAQWWHSWRTLFWKGWCPAFAKLYSSTSVNNSILASVQYIFIQKILPQHQPFDKSRCADVVSQTLDASSL